MGVTGLWKLLGSLPGGAQQYLTGEHAQRAVDGKIIAVDTSRWLIEAQTQVKLTNVFTSPHQAALVLVFRRISGILRNGGLPVAVLEGPMVVKKTGKALAGRAGLQSRARALIPLLEAFGIPVVEARGEAEQTCAVLNKVGKVDACDSKDGDCLLFGAQVVLSGLKLTTETADCSVLVCRAEEVWKSLGFGREGLVAAAQMIGNDFQEGTKDVGGKLAIRVVRWVIEKFGNEKIVESVMKLGTPGEAFGEDEQRLLKVMEEKCVCRKKSGEICEYHQKREDIEVLKTVLLLRQSNFFKNFEESFHVFLEEIDAQNGKDEKRFRWLHRPDVERLASIVPLKRELVMSNLAPVLMFWDSLQLFNFPSDSLRQWRGTLSIAEGELSKEAVWFKSKGIEFIPVMIKRTRSISSKEKQSEDWRYVVAWEVVPSSANYEDYQILLKKLSSQLRSLPKKVIELCCPALLSDFETKMEEKEIKKKDTSSLPSKSKSLPPWQTRIDDWFAQSRRREAPFK